MPCWACWRRLFRSRLLIRCCGCVPGSKPLTAIPKWVHPAIGGLATGALAVVGFAFFHLNGIAGDPYKTLDPGAHRNHAGHVHGRVLRAQAAGYRLLLFQWRFGRHLCAFAVYGSHAGRRRWLSRRHRLPPLGRCHRRLRRGGHGSGVCGYRPRPHDFRFSSCSR